MNEPLVSQWTFQPSAELSGQTSVPCINLEGTLTFCRLPGAIVEGFSFGGVAFVCDGIPG